MNCWDLWLRLRALLFRKRVERELEEELNFHIEMASLKNSTDGRTNDEAKRRAVSKFGSIARVSEECRDARRVQLVENFLQDVRYAIRTMRRNPGFTAVAVITLAVGIGANTAIFTLIDSVLLKSLPVRDPRSLVFVGDARGWGSGAGQVGSYALFSNDLYKHLQNANVFGSLCAFQSSASPVTVRRSNWNVARAAKARLVSGNYFEVLGVKAAAGRMIAPSDDLPSAPLTAVVSFRYWKERLNSDESAVNSTLDVNGTAVVIVGVAPPEFFGERLEPDPPSLWLPIAADRQLNPEGHLIDSPDVHWLFLMGRLLPDATPRQAEVRLTAALQGWLLTRERAPISEERKKVISQNRIELNPGGGGVQITQHNYSQTLRLLLGITGVVLLITCANVANLILARGAARRAEISIRSAVGATGSRLIQQSLTESLTLALAGGVFGLLFAAAGATMLVGLFFRGSEYVPVPTSPDMRVLGFTFAVSCASSMLFGLLPAIRMGSSIATEVKAGSSVGKGSAMSHRRFGFGKALIVGEVALSLVLLTGAGLFTRSLMNLKGQQFGFAREQILVVDIDPTLAHYDYNQLGTLYKRIGARLSSLPGVKSAALSYYSPFNGCCWAFSISVQDYTPPSDENMSALLNRVSPGYFETLGTRLLLGRTFDEHDTPTSLRVAVVNQEFVRRWFQNENPIGKHFGVGGIRNSGDVEIVGIVEDVKYNYPRSRAMPMAFFAMFQTRPGVAKASSTYQSNFARNIQVRSNGDPAAIAGQVQQALNEIDPNLPVLRTQTVSDVVNSAVNQEKVITTLAAFFGFIALLLTCVGLYGLMAYLVQRRTSEIGIRIALGARSGAVIGMILREVWTQALAGVALGIPVAFAASQLITSQLYGVSPNDIRESLVAALVLTVSISLAGYLPARRASRIDPWTALRFE